MKRIFKYLLFNFSIFVLTSCEDVVQIKLDEGSKLYVIDAFVNNLRQDQVIKVVTNDSYFSNRTPPPVTNANVTLTDLTENKQYNFVYAGNGSYVHSLSTSDTIAKLNHQYRLEVDINGDVYTSMTIQKRTAVIDSVASFLNNGGGFGPPSTDSSYICFLFARDKADNTPDYYWVKTFRNDTLFSSASDINICIDGTGGAVYDAPQDTIDFTPVSTFLGFKTYKRGDSCRVEIHSLSKENYYFFIQAFNQINNAGLFATTPENVKSNIISPADAKIKAIGRFNMASVASKTKVVK